jgi:hypothetical protein
MLDTVQGRDTSVRDTISKGRFVQGEQHPSIFSRGHINPASINCRDSVLDQSKFRLSAVEGREGFRV